MAKTFDATLKQLVDQFGADWTAFLCRRLGLPEGTRAEPLDADLSVASPQADKLFRLTGPAGGLLHLELESAWAGDAPDQLLLYSVLAEHRYGGPVYTVVILLRPEANATAVTGDLIRSGRTGEYLRFRYAVIRLWELPSAELFNGPVGILPLALLTNDAQPNLPDLIPRAIDRVDEELGATPEGDLVRTACLFLLGMRYDKSVLRQMFEGIMEKHQSSAYDMLLDMGQERALHKTLLKLGRKKFGPPTPENEVALKAITDLDRLDRMIDTLDQAADWPSWLQS
ncbi:MAG: hypothetical protein J2P46_08250 [Zavarzinella sp.]|nr:hypothetical protein [Zavarzinella sp.]